MMAFNSKEFSNRSEAERFKASVRGFVEITTDDKLNKTFIVFWPDRKGGSNE